MKRLAVAAVIVLGLGMAPTPRKCVPWLGTRRAGELIATQGPVNGKVSTTDGRSGSGR